MTLFFHPILVKHIIFEKNNSSLGQEWECPGVGKTEAQLFMPQEELLFPRSDSCQPRSEGWTFRPRLDIQTKAGSQTKEMKVPLKAWKVGLKVFNSWKHSNDALGILFFWGRGLDLRLDLDLSLRSELQHFENSLKVSRSSTENSRPKACYFPKSEARGQNWPLRLPSYTTSIKNH